jgi:opacity protein-like surface antigen
MKNYIRSYLRSLILTILLAASAVPVAWGELYYAGSMGGTVVEEAFVDDGGDTGEFSFEDGFALTGAIGQSFGDVIRIEVEGGYRANSFDEMRIDGSGVSDIDGDMRALSLMSNVYLNLLPYSDISPFIGFGAGVANIEADIDRYGSADDTVFAYQIAAGCSIAMSPSVDFEMQYRYFATEDPDFNGLETEYATHNLFLGLRFAF